MTVTVRKLIRIFGIFLPSPVLALNSSFASTFHQICLIPKFFRYVFGTFFIYLLIVNVFIVFPLKLLNKEEAYEDLSSKILGAIVANNMSPVRVLLGSLEVYLVVSSRILWD